MVIHRGGKKVCSQKGAFSYFSIGRKLLILNFIVLVLAFSVVSAADILDDLHVNIQVTDSSGNVAPGTYDFVFNVTSDSGCSNVLYSDSVTLTTDSRGIISYYLQNVDMNYSDQLYLCYYRDTVLINNSKIARVPYAFRARNVTSSGIDFDSNLVGTGYNFTADYFFGDGSGLTNINVSAIDLSAYVPYTGAISNLDLGDFNFSVGTSDFFVNSNLGRVGIGLVNPQTSLQLRSTSEDIFTIQRSGSDGDAGRMNFVVSSDATANSGGHISVLRNGGSDFDMIFGTRGTSGASLEKMRLTSEGYLGIGTTNPVTKLQVSNNGTFAFNQGISLGNGDTGFYEESDNNLVFRLGGTDSWKMSDTYFRYGATGARIKAVTADATTPTVLPYGDDDTGLGYAGTDTLSLIAGGTNVLNVNGSGNVGIGTTNPDAKLHVQLGANGDVAHFKGSGTGTVFIDKAGSGTRYNLAFGTAGSKNWYLGEPDSDIVGDGTEFFIGTTQIGSSPAVWIETSGNVGIGTANPQNLLNVAGDTNITGTLYVNGDLVSGGANVNGSGIAGRVAFWADSDSVSAEDNFTWDSTNKRLGIGTTAPTESIETTGNLKANGNVQSGSAYFDGINGMYYANSGRGAYGFGSQQAGGAYPLELSSGDGSTYTDGYISMSTNGSEALRVDSSGNVGIGTTSPDSKLHVEGDIRVPSGNKILLRTGQDDFYLSDSGLFSNTNNVYSIANTNTLSNSAIALRTGGSNRLYIDYTGNVGIGTTSPLNKFHVNDGTNENLQMSGSGGEFQIKTTNDADTAYIPLIMRASEFNIMSGNVGIGTTSPGAKLHVNDTLISSFTGTEDGQLKIAGDYVANYFSALDFSGYTGSQDNPIARIGVKHTGAGSQLHFGTSNSYGLGITNDAMVIDKDGKVGIGTTSPGYKLDVNGSINSNSNIYINGSPIATSSSANLTGAGSTNYLSKWTGTNNLGNSVVYDDGTNVGIGTTSPDGTLHVAVSNGGDIIFGENDGTNSNIRFLPDFTDGYNYIQTGVNSSDTSAKIRFSRMGSTSNLDEFRISADDTLINGNVGIGTTNSGAKLEVSEGTSGATPHPNAKELVVSDNANAGMSFLSPNGNYQQTIAFGNVANNAIGYIQYDHSDNHMDIVTNNIVTMRLDGKNVGIGTTNPGYKLDVNGSINSNSNIYINGSPIATSSSANLTGAGSTNYLSKWTGTSNLGNSVVYDDGTNVGIGTTTPSEKLTVKGNLKILDSGSYTGSFNGLRSVNNNALWLYQAGGGFLFKGGTGNDEILRIENLGNVGIGTTGPTEKLDVNGSIAIRGANTNYVSYKIYDDDGLQWAWVKNNGANPSFYLARYDNGAYQNVSINFQRSGDVSFQQAGAVIKSNGNVGIGTTAPGAKLHLKTDTPGQVLRIVESDSDNYAAGISTYANGGTLFLYKDNVATTYISGRDNSYFNYGNVGIGTTSPQAKLHVAGSAIFNGTVNVDSNKIINLANGTAAQDAVTKSQLDAVSSSAGANLNNSISGTVNHLAKFDSTGHAVVDSAVTEDASGNVTVSSNLAVQNKITLGNIQIYKDTNGDMIFRA